MMRCLLIVCLASQMKRRIFCDDESKKTPPESDEMSKWLDTEYERGKFSAPQLVSGCRAAAASSRDPPAIIRRRASWAACSTNAHRNVMRQYEKKCTLPECYVAKATFWDKEKARQYQGDLAFIPPHEIIYDRVTPDNVDQWCSFSDEQKDIEAMLDRACNRVGIDRTPTMGAFSVWGDSAAYWTRDQIYLLLFSFLSGLDHTRFWVTAFPKRIVCTCGCYGRHTFAAVWEVMQWSLEHLLIGRYPDRRHDGILFSESTYPGDKIRATLAGRPLGCRGLTVKNGETGHG